MKIVSEQVLRIIKTPIRLGQKQILLMQTAGEKRIKKNRKDCVPFSILAVLLHAVKNNHGGVLGGN
jgi:hypothetical protein